LQSKEQRERIAVVLVSPRNPLNIGAAARALANFGFEQLAVVAPYEAHWREAKSAVGAEGLLQNAKHAESLAEAASECTLVVGTGTLERRRPEQRVVRLPELAPLVREELARGGRVAVVFGPEKHGLTREDLSFCHLLVEIPTDKRQSSMNLGQAVAVCLYELSARLIADASAPAEGDSARPADSAHLELLAGVIEETMTAANYSPAEMGTANRRDLRLLLRRLALGERDARRMVGFFRRILWRLRR
jgi:TrmH family RNA methyltransferase